MTGGFETRLETRLESLESLETRLESLETRLETLETRLVSLETRSRVLRRVILNLGSVFLILKTSI